MLGGTAALLLVAAAIMLAAPLWITRRRKLRPLTAADAPAVVEEVAELAREQGLDPPRLYLEPADASAGGLAFGHPGRYSVAIGGGLVVKQAADPPAFRAVVRHELAHIRNRDVGITYFTICRLVRVPARRRAPLSRHPAGRRRHAHERHRAAGRARAPRLPDPQRGPAVARGLRRPARLGAGRSRRRSATGARRTTPTRRRPLQPTAERAPRSRPPAGRARRHAAALPARRSRRLRGRPDGDDCLRQRRSAALQLRHRPLRPALPGRTRPRPARGRRRRCRDLAGGVRRPRGGPRARVAVGRRPRPRRRVRARARARARPDHPRADNGLPGAGQHRRPGLGRGARWRPRPHRRVDPDERLLVAPGARRPAAGARADSGPARRRRSAHRVHGHLHDGPRAAAEPGGVARGVVRRAPAGRRAGLGRPGAGLAVRDGRRAARDRAQAVPRPRARAARPLPVRGGVRPPRPARRAVGLPRPGRPPANAAAGAPTRCCRSRSERWPVSAFSCSPRSSGCTCTTASAPRRVRWT